MHSSISKNSSGLKNRETVWDKVGEQRKGARWGGAKAAGANSPLKMTGFTVGHP